MASLNWCRWTAVFSVIVLGSIYFLWTPRRTTRSAGDQGVLIIPPRPRPNSTRSSASSHARGLQHLRQASGDRARVPARIPGQTLAGMVLKPWNERKADRGAPPARRHAGARHIAGLRAAVFQPPPLPGPSACRCSSSSSHRALREAERGSPAFAQEAQKAGCFLHRHRSSATTFLSRPENRRGVTPSAARSDDEVAVRSRSGRLRRS